MSAYDTAVLADGPYFYYKLNETSGTVATDSSGNARNGTYAGSVAFGKPGLLSADSGTAVAFDGSTAYGYYLGEPSAVFTAEFWMKATTGGGVLFGCGVSGPGPSGSNPNWFFGLQSNGKLSVGWYAGGWQGALSTASYTDGNPHYMVVICSNTAGTSVYVDNVLVISAATPLPSSQAGGGTYCNFGASTTGGDSVSNPGAYSYATMEKVALYSGALSSSRIAAHYTAGTTAAAGAIGNTDNPAGTIGNGGVAGGTLGNSVPSAP